jgi:hypothetical protein
MLDENRIAILVANINIGKLKSVLVREFLFQDDRLIAKASCILLWFY